MTEEHPLNPTTTYGASKASQDLLIQAFYKMYGINYFIFRPFNNFGERQNDKSYAGVIPITIQRIMNDEFPVQHGDGTQTRDFIYVKDTVDAVVKLANTSKSRNNIINVSRGKEIQIKDLIKIISEEMGYRGDIKVVPNPRRTDVKRHFSSNDKLKSMIDFSPTDLRIAIGKVIKWYRGNSF